MTESKAPNNDELQRMTDDELAREVRYASDRRREFEKRASRAVAALRARQK